MRGFVLTARAQQCPGAVGRARVGRTSSGFLKIPAMADSTRAREADSLSAAPREDAASPFSCAQARAAVERACARRTFGGFACSMTRRTNARPAASIAPSGPTFRFAGSAPTSDSSDLKPLRARKEITPSMKPSSRDSPLGADRRKANIAYRRHVRTATANRPALH